MTITALAATDLPVLMAIEQTAQLLGISRSAAYRAAAAGQIPTVRIGRRLLVPTARLLEMLGLEPPADPAAVAANN
ncbi:MAG: helix-turn-helix domain-containing protein [Actinobacteria bacterium]|jgi:excisionase family DNA binding protein|nr:helix-turn-helix domain-containing protein [Actinomycetota bacterium]